MTEPPESDIDWDETVEAVCVGSSPGVVAYAICCAANDLDVLHVRPPDQPDPGMSDWYAEMTADLAASLNPGRENTVEDRPGFSFARVESPPAPAGKHVTLEPFIGEQLRRWSARCLRSPFGVMFTEVPELLLPMRTDGGESITAALIGDPGDADVTAWLADRAAQQGFGDPENRMATAIVEEGRVAGVELDDGYRVRALRGLVWPVGLRPADSCVPGHGVGTVALVGRPAGRFATVDVLRP